MYYKLKQKLKKIPVIGKWLLVLQNFIKSIIRFFLRFIFLFKARYKIGIGLNQTRRDVSVIVSLTSIAPRFKLIHLTIRNLLSQDCKPDRIILWLSEYNLKGERAIDPKRLPSELTELTSIGLEIKFVKDIGSHGKLIYALKEFPKAIIVTADDDVLYPKYWLKRLYEAYLKEKDVIHFYRGRLITFNEDKTLKGYHDWPVEFSIKEKSLQLLPMGKDGVLYPPGVLSDEVFNEEIFKKICPKADDIWFKAMSLLNNIYCKEVAFPVTDFPVIPGSQEVSLYSENITKNDEQIKEVFEYYNLTGKIFYTRGTVLL